MRFAVAGFEYFEGVQAPMLEMLGAIDLGVSSVGEDLLDAVAIDFGARCECQQNPNAGKWSVAPVGNLDNVCCGDEGALQSGGSCFVGLAERELERAFPGAPLVGCLREPVRPFADLAEKTLRTLVK